MRLEDCSRHSLLMRRHDQMTMTPEDAFVHYAHHSQDPRRDVCRAHQQRCCCCACRACEEVRLGLTNLCCLSMDDVYERPSEQQNTSAQLSSLAALPNLEFLDLADGRCLNVSLLAAATRLTALRLDSAKWSAATEVRSSARIHQKSAAAHAVAASPWGESISTSPARVCAFLGAGPSKLARSAAAAASAAAFKPGAVLPVGAGDARSCGAGGAHAAGHLGQCLLDGCGASVAAAASLPARVGRQPLPRHHDQVRKHSAAVWQALQPAVHSASGICISGKLSSGNANALFFGE